MGDHVVLDVNKLVEPKSDEVISASVVVNLVSEKMEAGAKSGVQEEAMPLLQMAECRICQEEDSVTNLEMPCACSGSLKASLSI
jgi:RING-variant domain